jgi:hypothetical protein
MIRRYDVILRRILLRKIALPVLGFVALASLCHAEPRWCTITGFVDRESPVYPPIAKAANIQGAVLAHIIYPTTGKIESVKMIFGHQMLLKAVRDALLKWEVNTGATGDALCQTLVIVGFNIQEPGDTTASTPQPPPPGVGRVSVTAQTIILTEQAPASAPARFSGQKKVAPGVSLGKRVQSPRPALEEGVRNHSARNGVMM